MEEENKINIPLIVLFTYKSKVIFCNKTLTLSHNVEYNYGVDRNIFF